MRTKADSLAEELIETVEALALLGFDEDEIKAGLNLVLSDREQADD